MRRSRLRGMMRRTYRNRDSFLSIDGAIISRRGNTYLRALGSTKAKGTRLTGKLSVGSRGREVGGYAKRGNVSAGASYNLDSKNIRPHLIYKKKKIL